MDVLFVLDYDLTLTTEYQQEPLFRAHLDQLQLRYPQIKEPLDYFTVALENYKGCDRRVCYMYQICADADIFGPDAHEKFKKYSKDVQLAKGIPEFFPQLIDHYDESNVNLHFNIVSAGLQECITESAAAPYAAEIRAGSFEYTKEGYLSHPQTVVGKFDKIGAIIEIVKGGAQSRDKLVHPSERKFDYRNLICIGDGFSDVPKFSYVRERGGFPILVYNKEEFNKLVEEKQELLERVMAVVPQDYTKNGPISKMTHHFIKIMQQRTCKDEWDPRVLHVYRKDQTLKRKGQPSILPRKLRACIQDHINECKYCRTIATDQLLVIKPEQSEITATTPEALKASLK